MKDTEIIESIKRGATQRMKAIQQLYGRDGLKDRIASYVRSNSGTEIDAEDIFHDGIIAFDRNVRNGKFREESGVEVYVFSICKYLWMNKIRKKQNVAHPAESGALETEDPHSTDDVLHRKELSQYLDQVLDQVSEQCRNIFSMWKLSYSMKEIADRLDLSSPRLARKYKYRCMKRLIDYLDERPELRQSMESLLYG